MENNICEICEKEKPKYSCPKCNILYCSLACYKDQKHSKCSEEFYKAAVIEELKSQTGNDKKNIVKILQNLDTEAEILDPLDENEYLDSDDEEDIDLADRLKNVDLNDGDAIWEKLTDEERNQFQKIIDEGNILELVPIKEPWYMSSEQSMPELVTNIVEYSRICKKDPAATVKYNLVNILAAYSYMHRYFMGDYDSYLMEACNCLCILSGAIKRNCEFDSIETSTKAIYIEALSYQFEVDKEMHVTIIQDPNTILKGPETLPSSLYILGCLSDMIRMYKNLKKHLASNAIENQIKPRGMFSKRYQDNVNRIPNSFTKGTWSASIKRLEYFLSYTKFYYESEIMLLIK